MRYALNDDEWRVIQPMLPNKPRGVARVDDRRVLNGISWVLRSGAPGRDLPVCCGPHTTCYNRFARWRRAGVWDGIIDALAAVHDAAVQMIDTSAVRVHQYGACIARNREQHMGRSRGGLTSKAHAVVDTNGLPVRLGLTPGETHDNRLCAVLLAGLRPQTMLLADRGHDADWIRALVNEQGAWANIPPRRNRKNPICFSPIFTESVTWSSGSSTRSKNAGASLPVTTILPPTISLSSSSLRSDCGFAFMSPRSGTSGGLAHGAGRRRATIGLPGRETMARLNSIRL